MKKYTFNILNILFVALLTSSLILVFNKHKKTKEMLTEMNDKYSSEKEFTSQYISYSDYLNTEIEILEVKNVMYRDSVAFLKKLKIKAKKDILVKYDVDTSVVYETDDFLFGLITDSCGKEVSEYIELMELENISLDSVVAILDKENKIMEEGMMVCDSAYFGVVADNIQKSLSIKKQKRWNDIWKVTTAVACAIAVFR